MKKGIVLGVTLAALAFIWWYGGSSTAPAAALSSAEVRRSDALARAKVLTDEPFDARNLDFSKDPNAGLINPRLTTCTFVPTEPGGTTPKFDCLLEGGQRIKVKYGWTDEIPSEVASTRLLHALGFPADRMSRVAVLRCFGCGVSPFHLRLAARMLSVGGIFDRRLDYSRASEFKNVAVERRFDGESIEAGVEGWSFYELSRIDSRRGGATRAEVDALRLLAVFLGHWDNKAENQRLVCQDRDTDSRCERSFAMLQDLGSSFGPRKVNLGAWRTPVWADAATCTLSMKQLPYNGATFPDVQISDEGRRLLGDRLRQLSPTQIATLFSSAGFDDVDAWVTAFREKVRQIVDRGPCPASSVS